MIPDKGQHPLKSLPASSFQGYRNTVWLWDLKNQASETRRTAGVAEQTRRHLDAAVDQVVDLHAA